MSADEKEAVKKAVTFITNYVREVRPVVSAADDLREALAAWLKVFDPAALVEKDSPQAVFADAARATYAAMEEFDKVRLVLCQMKEE